MLTTTGYDLRGDPVRVEVTEYEVRNCGHEFDVRHFCQLRCELPTQGVGLLVPVCVRPDDDSGGDM